MSINRPMDKEDVVHGVCVCVYTMEYYSNISQKNEILPFAIMWMDLEGIMLCEMSDRKRQTLCGIVYMWNLKSKTN